MLDLQELSCNYDVGLLFLTEDRIGNDTYKLLMILNNRLLKFETDASKNRQNFKKYSVQCRELCCMRSNVSLFIVISTRLMGVAEVVIRQLTVRENIEIAI